jgi:hypothetical protein
VSTAADRCVGPWSPTMRTPAGRPQAQGEPHRRVGEIVLKTRAAHDRGRPPSESPGGWRYVNNCLPRMRFATAGSLDLHPPGGDRSTASDNCSAGALNRSARSPLSGSPIFSISAKRPCRTAVASTSTDIVRPARFRVVRVCHQVHHRHHRSLPRLVASPVTAQHRRGEHPQSPRHLRQKCATASRWRPLPM